MEHIIKRLKGEQTEERLDWEARKSREKLAWEACKKRDIPMLNALLKIGSPSDFKFGSSPFLHIFAAEGALDVVKSLVEYGAEVDLTCDGETALFEASWNGHADVMIYLIEKGANVNASNPIGNTSLSMAIQKDQLVSAEILLKHGVNVNGGSDGYTYLMHAAAVGNLRMVQFLVKNGASVNAECSSGCLIPSDGVVRPTALSESLRKKCDIVRFLLENGALATTRHHIGNTYLHVLSYGICDESKEKAEAFIEYGCNLYAINIFGQTCADNALFSGKWSLLFYFLEKGVRLSENSISAVYKFHYMTLLSPIFERLPPVDLGMILKVGLELNFNWKEERKVVCRIPIQMAVSLLIGREMSPFRRHRFPLDLLKVIFDMCGFLPLPIK
jgi:ankyrin repeat protein